ncbi:hypothetical protein J3R30DRAFT_3526585 [Lentinula aciculospora]|uniref:F-box domain-containing protein n=1 Tax=Lentinula aciculospora TaxID=153920 RepID=A0A9W9DI32_9AGAR|nr:hypothetical protein J3R30DRAFT_3526585 [Lentinula aciculospora]
MAQYVLQPRIEDIPICLSPADISFLQTRISSIEMEAARLQTDIFRLKCQLKVNRQALAVIHNILAPIRRLPSELLSNIFREYCSLKKIRPITSRKSLKPQLLISQICSTWRNVAFGTPTLWSELGILLSERGEVSYIDTMMAGSWLERSGSLPLDVGIAQWHPNSSFYPENLFNQLVPFCNRLRSLSLVLPFQYIPSFLDKEPTFPTLKKMDLTFLKSVDKSSSLQSRRFTTFLNAPRLHTVKLKLPGSVYDNNNDSSLSKIIIMLPLPANQLHSIHLELRDPDDFYSWSDAHSYLNVLRSCQSTLVECRLVHCPAWLCGILVKDPIPMTFLALKVLCLEQWGEESEARFIQLVTVPSLITLRVDHSKYGGDDPCDIFSKYLINLQTRSSAPLSTLELVRVRLMCAEDILSVLAVFPTLICLKLCDCNLNTKLLMRGLLFGDSRGHKSITPKLESLHLVDFEVIPKGCESFIIDMVESRTAAVNDLACFNTLTVAYRHHQITKAMITRLNELLLALNLKAKN